MRAPPQDEDHNSVTPPPSSGHPRALNGIDRWIGGVHLQGHHVPWRWDDGTESIVYRPGKT